MAGQPLDRVSSTGASSPSPMSWITAAHRCPGSPRLGDGRTTSTRAEFQDILNQIEMCLTRFGPGPIVVAEDLNAKSALWGSPATSARGRDLEDWMAERNLCPLNREDTWTCVRFNGGSIVDVTLANPEGLRRAAGWWVVEGVETMSDHRYVEFSLSATPREILERRRETRDKFPRWQWRKADRDLFKAAIRAALWEDSVLKDATVSVEDQAERIGAIMKLACDAAMPRSKPIPRKSMYWWTEEIAELRRFSVYAIRVYTRARARQDPVEEEEARESYRSAKRAFSKAVKVVKDRAWEKLLQTLEEDPWGRPYGIVLNKLKPWAPPRLSLLTLNSSKKSLRLSSPMTRGRESMGDPLRPLRSGTTRSSGSRWRSSRLPPGG
ncbi:uncharacterized protein [Temnothorax longispinosus]|uniref:uncharacterized protein n=1 Tax=Temnothorax longispinosus TaxID=300112 RepID=UPI003A98D18C